MLFNLTKLCFRQLLLSYFILTFLSVFTAHAVTIDRLTSDYSNSISSQNQTVPIDLKNSLYNGKINEILTHYNNPTRLKNSDDFAYLAIALFATSQIESGKHYLSEAEKNAADQGLVACARASMLRQNKKFDQAEANALEALKITPEHPYILNILGRIYFDLENYQEAIRTFNLATSINKHFLPAYLNIGATYLRTNQNKMALHAFDLALAENSGEQKAFLGKIYAYKALLQVEKALKTTDIYLDKFGSDEQILTLKADLLYILGNFEKVLMAGKELESYNSTTAFYWQGLALLHLNKVNDSFEVIEKIPSSAPEKACLSGLLNLIEENYRSAEKGINTCLAESSTNVTASIGRLTLDVILNNNDFYRVSIISPEFINYFKALYFLKNNDLISAEQHFLKADNIIPGFSMTGIDSKNLPLIIDPQTIDDTALGTFLYLTNFKTQSKLVFEKISKNHSGTLLANFWLGQMAWEQGATENSATYMRRCINTIPFYSAYYSLAELSIQGRNFEQAKEYYENAIRIKTDAGILLKLGLLYEKEDNYTSVEKVYTKLIRDFNNLYVGYNQYAWFLTKNDLNLDKAWEYAEKANNLQPDNASILDTLGWLSFKKKDYNKAEKFLTRAYNVNPATPSILFHLGALQKELNKPDAAKLLIKKALELNANFDEAGLARKMLQEL